MRITYENAASTTLRLTLVWLKENADPNTMIDASTVIDTGICNADPASMLNETLEYGYGQEAMARFKSQYEEWTRVSKSIRLHAPVIDLKYLAGEHEITGMCLANECADGDFDVHVTYLDPVAPTPVLSEHQEHAVAALNRMSTDTFWLETAYRNHIYDDAKVLASLHRIQKIRDHIISPSGKPSNSNIQ
jgi:hypothetical protein